MMQWSDLGLAARQEVARWIADAVATEREACARIAGWMDYISVDPHRAGDAREIARSIRERGNQ